MSRPEIGLVEDGDLGLEDGHLEHLEALLLAAREPVVHIAAGETLVHAQQGHLLAHLGPEVAHRDAATHRVGRVDVGVLVDALEAGVERGADERRDAQAGDGGRVLEGEEQAEARPLVRGQGEDVATLPADLAAGHDVRRMAGERVGERGLARAVGPHDRVDLAAADREVDALEDLVLAVRDGRDAQTADDEVLVGGLGHGVLRLPAGRGRMDRWRLRRPRPRRGVAGRGRRGSSSRGSRRSRRGRGPTGC